MMQFKDAHFSGTRPDIDAVIAAIGDAVYEFHRGDRPTTDPCTFTIRRPKGAWVPEHEPSFLLVPDAPIDDVWVEPLGKFHVVTYAVARDWDRKHCPPVTSVLVLQRADTGVVCFLCLNPIPDGFEPALGGTVRRPGR